MRIISLDKLTGSEVLGKRIYDAIGSTLLSEGVKLTPAYIEKLKAMGIRAVFIEDEISKNIQIEDSISEKTRQTSKHAIQEVVEKYSREGKVHSDGIIKSASSIIDEILTNREVMMNVSEIRAKDDIYSHSVNVCALAVVSGIHMGYNMLRLKDVAVGALLHDIGKIKLLKDQELSGEKKTEEEFRQYIEKIHPKAGYDFLGMQNSCSAVSKVAVLMHHERYDGSGYPFGAKGSEIHEVAKLVAICNEFDNMIAGNKDYAPKHVYEVLEYLVGMSGFHFDSEVVKKFTANIAAFPTGSGVKLNTHERCLVVRQNKSFPTRPVVKAIFDKNGEKISEPYEIDLNKELTVFVMEACDI